MPVTKVKSKWVEGDLVFSGNGKLNLGVFTTLKRTIGTVVGTTTLTITQMLAGHLDGTPTGDATYTTPTAAEIVAAIPGAAIGTSFYFSVNNVAVGSTITLAGGVGITADGALTVSPTKARLFVLLTTAVGTPAISIYGMGA